jgi:small subunit ribosomal protein S15
MLTTEDKGKIIEKFKSHDSDTGSTEIQVALLTEEIKRILLHLKKNPKDIFSKRGLLKMVTQRRRLLKYLKEQSVRSYNSLIKKLGIKK